MALFTCVLASNTLNKIEHDASEFFALMTHNTNKECSEATYMHALEQKEVCFSSRDCKPNHVDSTVALSNSMPSSTQVVQESVEGLYDLRRQLHCPQNGRLINLRRILVGKVRVHFSKNMDNELPDRHFHISKGGLRIQTTVTSNPSTVVAYIRFFWKKYLNHTKHYVVGLDCEYTRYVHKKERQKLPPEEQAALSNQEPQRAAILQLCVGRHCLIYQLYQAHARGFIPPLLSWFLRNDTIRFAGAAIGNDIQKLKFYNLAIKNVVDLQQLGIKVHNHKEGQLVSLEKLAKKVAKIKLNKDKSVSASLWESSNLNHEQIKYACLDAYASFEVFRKHSSITGYLRSD
jgi:hypothetical protein